MTRSQSNLDSASRATASSAFRCVGSFDEHLLERGESPCRVLESPLEYLTQADAKGQLRCAVVPLAREVDLRIEEIGQLLVLARTLEELREREDCVGVPGLLVENGAQRRGRSVDRLESRLLEASEVETERGPHGCGGGHVDEALEQLAEIPRPAGLLVERTELRRRELVVGLLLEDLLVKRDRMLRVLELVLQDVGRALLQLDDLQTVRGELRASQEQLHHLGGIPRGLSKACQLVERPRIDLVLDEDVAQDSLRERAVTDRLLGETLGLAQQLPLRLELRLELRARSERRDEVRLAARGPLERLERLEDREVLGAQLQRLLEACLRAGAVVQPIAAPLPRA